MFLVIVDVHSKWPEVIPMKKPTSISVINALSSLFIHHGLPCHIVSNNGSQFTSKEFTAFLEQNGVHHIAIPQYHPAINGLAETFGQTFKDTMKCSKATEKNYEYQVQTFLMSYPNRPHSTTGVSLAELIYGRPLRTRMNLLKPESNKLVQKAIVATSKPERAFKIGERPSKRFSAQSKQMDARNYCRTLGEKGL